MYKGLFNVFMTYVQNINCVWVEIAFDNVHFEDTENIY